MKDLIKKAFGYYIATILSILAIIVYFDVFLCYYVFVQAMYLQTENFVVCFGLFIVGILFFVSYGARWTLRAIDYFFDKFVK